jgi:signal transduction histidine kinase
VTVSIDEMVAHVGLDAADRARLIALHDVLAPQFSAFADAFYAAARRHVGTAAIPSSPDQLAQLRSMLIDWMSAGLRGPYDDAFSDRRLRIANRHLEIGFAPHDMILGMNLIRRAYRGVIAATYQPLEAHGVNDAVDKLLDLELALMLRDSCQDSGERALAGERLRRVDQVQALRTLCAGLAHEVRNPVNSAKLQLALATRRLRRGGDPTLLEPVELAGHEIDRLTTLLDEFLAFAQPAALSPQAEDVVALVRGVVEHDRRLAEQHGARLTLVAAPEPIIAEIDAVKLRQVVESLVRNALEAVNAGGEVSVAVVAAEDRVHIRVTDDGPGIPTAVLPRIYEPFFSTKEGGTGMGLSIVHSLVTLHEGTTEVTSSPAGTTFDVAVPRRRGNA